MFSSLLLSHHLVTAPSPEVDLASKQTPTQDIASPLEPEVIVDAPEPAYEIHSRVPAQIDGGKSRVVNTRHWGGKIPGIGTVEFRGVVPAGNVAKVERGLSAVATGRCREHAAALRSEAHHEEVAQRAFQRKADQEKAAQQQRRAEKLISYEALQAFMKSRQ